MMYDMNQTSTQLQHLSCSVSHDMSTDVCLIAAQLTQGFVWT